MLKHQPPKTMTLNETEMKTISEQIKQYGVEKYAEVEKDEKVKFAINIFGLAKTENGWKKFWLEDTVSKPEFRLEEEFQDEVRKSKKASWTAKVGMVPLYISSIKSSPVLSINSIPLFRKVCNFT